jgi:glycine C-acetyltransferase
MASFMGTEAAIAYSSGYAANLSTISTLTGRHDIVITDRLSHASIVDGCMLSQAEFVRFKHNDLADLAKILEKAGSNYKGKLVVVDAVYSMDGDLCPLPDLLQLCRDHRAWLLVDEAHSLGVLGETGRGILEYYGITADQPGLILSGSLSKTIPAVGGYIAGKANLINFLKHSARAFVFSAALPPAAVAAAKTAFEVMEEETWRLEAVRRNIRRFIEGLHALGYNTLNTKSCVIPIIIGQPEPTLSLTCALHDDGMFVSPILPPAVPAGTCRLRANVTSAHTGDDIDFALGLLERHGQRMGIIA